MSTSSNYADSGVNIDAGNQAVDQIKSLVQSTHTPNVLHSLGHFAGFYELPTGYQQPVLVSCTDGVGTKLKLAIETGIFDTIGIDLVAMCVNDLICAGAKPLYFLDYIACHELVPNQIESIIRGITDACRATNCALIGGEMAEMRDMYRPNDFDVAGFSVGIVEKSKIIDGSKIESGHYLYAFPSSGLHSNGFSLARQILTDAVLTQHNLSKKDLLTPTRLYVSEVLSLVDAHPITGIAHITGGGLVENISRILPSGLALSIDQSAIPIPDIFTIIQDAGSVSDDEMNRVFNMGIGMVLVSSTPLPDDSEYTNIGRVITNA